jgi:uncharacterized protein (TIGR03118 family)
VTGAPFNPSQGFTVATGKPSSFIFCTEDGTVSGWNSTVNATNAKILVDNSATGAVYKACVVGGTTAAPLLYLANFGGGTVDVYDGTMTAVKNAGAFVDSTIPAGFAPFNVMVLGGKVYVSYAKQNAAKHDDVAGAGNGYVTVFDASGNLISHLIAKGPLNSPWGMQIAPASFGDFGGKLLVSNFGDGTINAFDPSTGALSGTLKDSTNHTLQITGLWDIQFGNGGRGGDTATLYFTAGIAGPYGEPAESHGLFGSIQAAPAFQTSSVVNAASYSATLAPNTWASIIGGGLSAFTRGLATTDISGNKLPTQMNGVSITVNNEAAYLSYVSPTQIDFLIPSDAAQGPAQIVLNNNGLTNAAQVNLSAVAPGMFWLTGNKYVAATHANGTLAAPANTISGVPSTPVKAGEILALYVNGLGPTSPAIVNGGVVTSPQPLVATASVTVGGMSATVLFAGLTETGVYQINIVVPQGLAAGDAPVVVSVGGGQSQANAMLSIS